ncbi:MAG TPA: DNA alkylation repair protein [Edaphocola sp.]|nr:DNA alkylation repair protein [Edaphocola sp.]
MSEFIDTLEFEFKKHSNIKIALGQKAYMRNQFEFYGIKTPIRTSIQKPFFIKQYRPEKSVLEQTIRTLWQKPEREYQYFSQELAFKYATGFEEKDIELLEYMVSHKSWWDTVDFIANKLMGSYFITYPEKKLQYIQKWISSDNIWLQRSALLFQLKYKKEIDTHLLEIAIHPLLNSKEFFINKAIGWILREYSKTNPNWVIDFVNKTSLNSLSKKEALRLIR